MIVSPKELSKVLGALASAPRLSCDTETSGLRSYHGDRPFSIIIGDGNENYYFNLLDYSDPRYPCVDDQLDEIRAFFGDYSGTWFMQNAKFDMHMLASIGVFLHSDCRVHCTKAIARLIKSDYVSYSLDRLSSFWLKEPKDDKVMAYIKDNKDCWEWEETPGIKTRRKKRLFFYRVPPDIIIPYALKDADLTFRLGMYELKELTKYNKQRREGLPAIDALYYNECELTKTLWQMERRGVAVDLRYCRRAFEHEQFRMTEAMREFESITRRDFVDSHIVFSNVFSSEKHVLTEKGNPCFKSDVLKTFKNPAAKSVLDYRDARSRANFFAGFEYEADENGIVHTSFWQDGTTTGRLSSSSPNLQNMTKDALRSETDFPVRRAIVPRPGKVFHCLDYDQVEYRLMLEYANAHGLIDKVLAGTDVHQATADAAGIDRNTAKTINFTVLYGGGNALISQRLGIPPEKARELVNTIFDAAPEVRTWMDRVRRGASLRGGVVNWMGRPIRIRDKIHASVNYLIQGGCADVMKVALNRTAKLLKDTETKPVLTIHDEIVLEGPDHESHLAHDVKREMEGSYPSKRLTLTTGVDYSFRSLADKLEGVYSPN